MIQYEIVSDIYFLQELELDQYSLPEWEEILSSPLHDLFSETLSSDKAIIEAMMMSEIPWEDYHH